MFPRPRTLLLFGWVLTLGLAANGLLLWPRMVPYYYPLPVSSSSSSSVSSSYPSGIHSGTQYMYDWNSYNSQNPHSSVLYPSSNTYVPPSSTISSSSSVGSSSPFSGLSRLFQKPWLTWKLAKFGLRSPSSPCSTSAISSASLFPSLSSSTSSYPPCTTATTVCCSTGVSGSSRPHYVQTHVSSYPTSYDTKHSSQVHYPSSYHYSPSSYPGSGSSSSSATPQASEQSFDFVSS